MKVESGSVKVTFNLHDIIETAGVSKEYIRALCKVIGLDYGLVADKYIETIDWSEEGSLVFFFSED